MATWMTGSGNVIDSRTTGLAASASVSPVVVSLSPITDRGVLEQAVDDVSAAEVLGEPGQRRLGIACRRQPEVVEQVRDALRRAPAQRVGRRRAEPGGVGAEDVARGAHQLQGPGGTPDEGEAAQPV